MKTNQQSVAAARVYCPVRGGVTHLMTEVRDSFGRSRGGYSYSKDGAVQQTASAGYGTDGRIASAGFMHSGEEKLFAYGYLFGSNLLVSLSMPNGVALAQTYEAQRDLLAGMAYATARKTTRQGSSANDTFACNKRSELANAAVSGKLHGYDYDNIGNRRNAIEGQDYAIYAANSLNQYTDISGAEGGESYEFEPAYDDAGNQTLVKTSTGIWTVFYNAENRPVRFTRTEADGTKTRIACAHDYMGRRATKPVETVSTVEDGTETATAVLHQRYIYRGYLQIAACDLAAESTPCLWGILWDPTQPVAARPLAIRKDAVWHAYGWDLTNIGNAKGNMGFSPFIPIPPPKYDNYVRNNIDELVGKA